MNALLAGGAGFVFEQLHELGCTDGLPVVVPTGERVARMVLASGMEAEATWIIPCSGSRRPSAATPFSFADTVETDMAEKTRAVII